MALPKEWINKTRLDSAADAFEVKISANAAIVATTSRNCAHRNFQTSHDRNLRGIGRLDATPVAALAGGGLDTQRPAAQA